MKKRCPGSETEPTEIHRIARRPSGQPGATGICPICGTEVFFEKFLLAAHDAPPVKEA